MTTLKTVNVISIIEKALNCVDVRLIDHGKRVAYKVFRILKRLNSFGEAQMRDACVTALLHDIGAYKTENINQLLFFETENTWDHSIYGYLFTKFFSPLVNMSPFVLLHHATCEDLQYVHPFYRPLSQILFIADRLDILYQSGIKDEEAIARTLNKYRGVMFFPNVVDLIIDNRLHIFDEQYNSDAEFNRLLYHSDWTESEVEAFLKMIIFSIDFRSPQTVTHTIATTCISKSLAELLPMDDEDRYLLNIGAWLHDLGKSGIPIEILENPNKLNPKEMEIIRNHIVLTDEILTDNVNDKIRFIASRHHEKLNGSGYPNGLSAKELSLPERVVAVADIFSALCGARSYKQPFSKEEVTGILQNMSEQNLLDGEVVNASIAHYDFILERISKASGPILDLYAQISKEYMELMGKVNSIGGTASKLFFTIKHEYTYRLARIEEW